VTRHAAFLRGVSPSNAKMPQLKACFERAAFTEVKTVLSSGNVVFSARAGPVASIESQAEAAMKVEPARDLPFPIELDGARILGKAFAEVFTAYVPGRRGPVFMTLIEKTFGKELTTRTWETVKKIAA
jgi:uncharacterized protein (DUF1697 family)